MTRRREILAVVALLLVQTGQLVYAVGADGMTYDELLYVAAGYRQLALGDHRFGAEHPPLALLLSALPLLPLHPVVRDLGAEEASKGWDWAYQFLHNDNSEIQLLHRSRLMVVVLSLLLSLALWKWSRDAYGVSAGLAALCLSVFHPSLLAHGHLSTTEMAGTLSMILFSWALWRFCEAPTWGMILGVATALGAALATRLTGLLLIPLGLLICVHWLYRSGDRRLAARRVAQLVVACLVLAPILIWAAYGFRYAAWPGEPDPQTGAMVWARAIEGTPGAAVLGFLKAHQLFPAAYLASLQAYLIKSTVGHQAYLLGQVSATGWWYYYLIAALVKNTPGFLLALAIGAGLVRKTDRRAALHCLAPAVLMFAAASLSRVQVGERYILSVYAYLILWLASMTPLVLRQKAGGALAAAILVLHAAPALQTARAGYLPYFNFMVDHDLAHRVLADSNLDWGQDLPRLAAWSAQHPDRPLQVAYWGMDSPDVYGLVREDLPGQMPYPAISLTRPPFTGWVAVSPTLLAGLYPPAGTEEILRSLSKRTPDDHAGVFLIYNLSR
ncbi:MAG: glycosyltransferase family 39 protein [Vicinamibacteria bacterium]